MSKLSGILLARKLDTDYWKAAEALSVQVGKVFPIGMAVYVLRGNARFHGTICGHGISWSDPDRVRVESRTGWKFGANWQDVRPA